MNSVSAAPTRGRFITFEGGEGAGKSTQVRLLSDRLEHTGVRCISTREPGGSAHAENLRAVLLSGKASALGPIGEAMLFGAARIDHLDTLIRPALDQGTWVLCDRFADSTRAYQGAAGNAPSELIAALEDVVVGPTRPDLTILMDIPPEIGLARAKRRAGDAAADRFEGEDLAFHTALRQAFLDIAAHEPGRVRVVDATRSQEPLADDIWTIVREKFGLETAAGATGEHGA